MNTRSCLSNYLSGCLCILSLLILSCVSTDRSSSKKVQEIVPIVLSPQASSLEYTAADELRHYLEILYPRSQFPVRRTGAISQPAILLGTLTSFPQLKESVSVGDLRKSESFVVTNQRNTGIIAATDPRGTLYGVYALLEKLGFGFYLSYESAPDSLPGKIDFSNWNLKDAPLVAERFALNWHNFLSGCSSWNMEDWQKWVFQLAKMRYNTIMVHAYGNNPMFYFTHNDQTKPVGYLASTHQGRDWGTQHVNDVRLLIGGDETFSESVYASSAALVPEGERGNAAIAMMRRTFEFADQRGMNVWFALDVDTVSSNPQNIITTLPSSARLSVQGQWVANPDTPEGLAYYQSLVKSLLDLYPQIDRIALWFRRCQDQSLGTLWRSITLEEFPSSWKTEYQQILSEHPQVANDPESPSLFALAKMAQAFRASLDALDHKEVSLAAGSWGYSFLPAAQVFFPPEMALLPLDYDGNLTSEETTRSVDAISQQRSVTPIVWAHHDDRTYMGRPHMPYSQYASYLTAHKMTGLGIIHWTTRPLDLYFKNLAQQVWQQTRDEAILTTCQEMAHRTFGPSLRESMGEYLHQWIQNAPVFGRETTDTFIDRPLDHPESLIEGCQKRLAMLDTIKTISMSSTGKKRYYYHKLFEEFSLRFVQNQSALDRCRAFAQRYQIGQAYDALAECDPEPVILSYARLSAIGGITPGEKGLLVSLNLRWLPQFMHLRQLLREEPIRINFQPTRHESLAQAPGMNTFFVDTDKNFWLGLGQYETGLGTFRLDNPLVASTPFMQEIGQTGIQTAKKNRFRLLPFAAKSIPSGNYKVNLYVVEPQCTQVGERVFNLILWPDSGEIGSRPVPYVKDRIDILQRARERNRVIQISYLIDIQEGALMIELEPIRNSALLCGIVLEPIELIERPF